MSDTEPNWEGTANTVLSRQTSEQARKEKGAPTTHAYEGIITLVDNKVKNYSEERGIPDYLMETTTALDAMNRKEVEGLKNEFRKLQQSTDLGLIIRQAQEKSTSKITKEKIETIVEVRNFLAYDSIVDLAANINNQAIAKNLTTEAALNKVIKDNKIDTKQLAKTFTYALRSGSYQRLKNGEIPEERRDRENEDTSPTIRFIGARLRSEIDQLKSATQEMKVQKGRLATEPIEEPGIQLADYNFLYDFIYASSDDGKKLREAVENNTATPAQVLELAERYTRAIQSEEYGRKLNIDPARASQTTNAAELNEIRNGYDALNRYLINSTDTLKGQDSAQLKEAYDKAIQSGWLQGVAEDASRYDLNRLSRNKILSWFEKLKLIFEPTTKPTPPFRIPFR